MPELRWTSVGPFAIRSVYVALSILPTSNGNALFLSKPILIETARFCQ